MGLFDRLFQRARATPKPSLPPWAESATRCLNAYIKRDYQACTVAGGVALLHELIPTVAAITVLGLRRLGQAEEAEACIREQLARGMTSGRAGEICLFFMMLMDGALDPELFLREHF